MLKKLGRELFVRASTLKPEDMAGITEPFGFLRASWLSESGDVSAYGQAEIKPSRVCMQASLGIIAAGLYHPFFDAWVDGVFAWGSASHFTLTTLGHFLPSFWLWPQGMNLLLRWPIMLAEMNFSLLALWLGGWDLACHHFQDGAVLVYGSPVHMICMADGWSFCKCFNSESTCDDSGFRYHWKHMWIYQALNIYILVFVDSMFLYWVRTDYDCFALTKVDLLCIESRREGPWFN